MNIEDYVDYKKGYNKFRKSNIQLRSELIKRDEKILMLKDEIKKLKKERYNYYC